MIATLGIREFVSRCFGNQPRLLATHFTTNFDNKLPLSTIDCRFDADDLVQYNLIIERNKASAWSAVMPYDDEFEKAQDGEIEVDFPEMEMEVADWIRLNPTLFQIEIIFNSDREFFEDDFVVVEESVVRNGAV